MTAESKNNPSSHTDAELWLEKLGLQASSMDPSSLEALADVLSGQHVDFLESSPLRGGGGPTQPPPPRQHDIANDGREGGISPETREMIFAMFGGQQQQQQHDDSSGRPRSWQRKEGKDEEEEEEEETIMFPEEATAVERLILEKLGQQSKMLKKLERRLDAFKRNDDVDRGTNSTRGAVPAAAAGIAVVDPKQERFLNALYRLQQEAAGPRGPAHVPEQSRPPPPPRVVVFPQAPARAGPPPVAAAVPAAVRGRGGAASAIALRFRRCFTLFLSLRRHHVPNDRIDGWMLIKIMFMLSILLTKNQSKLFIVLTVVCIGFLWQTGLAGFLFKFIVRYNYVGRIIFRGEDITFAAALAEQQGPTPPPPPQPAAQARNAAGPDAAAAAANNVPEQRPAWYHPDPNRHFVVNLLIDVVLIIGSLFLSIFPMWRAPDPPPVRDVPPPEAAAAADANPLPHHPQQQQQEGAIPVVRPPVDPAAAESDDDDDDDENRDDDDRH